MPVKVFLMPNFVTKFLYQPSKLELDVLLIRSTYPPGEGIHTFL